MQFKEYSIEEQFKKTPAQIAIMSLLMSSKVNINALVRVLNGINILEETTSKTLAAAIGRMVEASSISFHDDELPQEGANHNKALHITIKIFKKIMPRVLIDCGSGCNISTFATLRDLGVNMGEIKESHIKVKDFDRAQRSVIGVICLTLQVGLAEFPILFQVMDVSSTYNLLLGRPWVHMVKVIPSTLHQCIKFECGRIEVTFHGELSHPISSASSVPVEDRVKELDGATFHTLEIMQATKVGEKMESDVPKMSRAAKIVASEMLKYGDQPKEGLGPNINGNIKTIQLKHQKGTIGLGYDPTMRGVHSEGTIVFMPEKFSKPDQVVEEDLTEGMKHLFVAMVGGDQEKGFKMLTIHDAKPGEVTQNWTTGPTLFRRESW